MSPSPSYNSSTTRPSLKPKGGRGAGLELKIRNSMSVSTELLWAVWTPCCSGLVHPRGKFRTIPACSVVESKIRSFLKPQIQFAAPDPDSFIRYLGNNLNWLIYWYFFTLIDAVLGIRFSRFLGLLDPDPLVRDTDPDPSIIKQNSKKNLDFYCFVTSLWLFYLRKMTFCFRLEGQGRK